MDFKHEDSDLERFVSNTALHMGRICVRNTVIENYHVEGKLSQKEMEAFNREVANKLYSYLQLLFTPSWLSNVDYCSNRHTSLNCRIGINQNSMRNSGKQLRDLKAKAKK